MGWSVEQVVNDESSLLVRVPKSLSRKQIDASLNRLFAKELSFESGRQVRNPNCSNARYSLSCPIKVNNIKTAFDVYEQIKLAESKEEKLSNYKLSKLVGSYARK